MAAAYRQPRRPAPRAVEVRCGTRTWSVPPVHAMVEALLWLHKVCISPAGRRRHCHPASQAPHACTRNLTLGGRDGKSQPQLSRCSRWNLGREPFFSAVSLEHVTEAGFRRRSRHSAHLHGVMPSENVQRLGLKHSFVEKTFRPLICFKVLWLFQFLL